MNRIIGYYRVSTEEQNLDMQERTIQNYAEQRGVALVLYVEKVSSRKYERVELSNAMKSSNTRRYIQQRIKARLEAAHKRGRICGRPLIGEKTKKRVRALFEAGERAIDIVKEYNIGRLMYIKL
ncbi:hypothetical protein AEA09_06125 [Lysinibacillus contaminans]|uniref:Resolvase/invertase-type recombinase catalytic domain-containing protein n=1 Tax=Lysinibacillus contaminans TaxID=1293441 RepID=A0ABR5K0B1_9BACI|nr:recombinase family protein [Lysinibacillus contaminans]KOS68170.1 hypothetical protein AEA09_06125 [Lysinibacillus contaminans]